MRLSPDLFATIREACERAFPEEACGVVVRDAAAGAAVREFANIQNALHAADPVANPRDARTAYALSAEDSIWLDRLGSRLLAIWHSHPDHDAYFSDTDIARAAPWGDEATYPEAVQIVVSVRDGRFADVRAYRWSPEDCAFVEHGLELDA